jgi:glycosyltransferase involved in cell wall biosynthesis
MKILIVLTYYRPHISGLTIYAERLAKAFAKRGNQVTILTSQFSKALPLEEIDEGVRIVRVPVWFRISKGVIMPKIGWMATRLVADNDVIQLHLPQFDAAGISLRGRITKKPTITTYHCDLNMPAGILSKAANYAINFMNFVTAINSHRIVTYTQDYADNSKYIQGFLKKTRIVPPPVILPKASPDEIVHFKSIHNPEGKYPVIGMAARFASEKGVEVLIKALPIILKKYPDAKIQYVGAYQNIMGEESYLQRLLPSIQEFEKTGHWEFVGELQPAEIAAFYPNLDILVLPSLNSTEAFGLVQIEAMMNGVPCVASNLSGVRQPVKVHNMGKIFNIGDSAGLAQAVDDVLQEKIKKQKISENEFSRYSPDAVAAEYEKLFAEIKNELS